RRLDEILGKLASGQTLVLVTESGTPGVSDPGARLVDAAFAAGIKIVPLPGPSAVAVAASVCGFGADAFHFAGFLPKKPGKRRKILETLKSLEVTMIFFESPYRVAALLEDALQVLGDRRLTVCRELTKLHEEVWRTTLAQALARYRKEEPRGEFTLAVEGSPSDEPAQEKLHFDLEPEEIG
ncbi:MAG TPA: ribosomal RNA small subunit methyltransferase I, partial [Planctomycetota bacterium]|nr:ribosomal RNA small subunit methyltransferase I [Planctomycetota bacterium]